MPQAPMTPQSPDMLLFMALNLRWLLSGILMRQQKATTVREVVVSLIFTKVLTDDDVHTPPLHLLLITSSVRAFIGPV